MAQQMKFVFLKSGDYIELELNPATVITHWFEYLFEQKANSKIISTINNSNKISKDLIDLNNTLANMNRLLAERIPENNVFFKQNNSINQQWLNTTHKQWAMLTDTYPHHINPGTNPFPYEWHRVNHLIHGIETAYFSQFVNEQIQFLPNNLVSIVPSDYTFQGNGLILSYDNLGRHQYNQWAAGTTPDDETNNYKKVSFNFEYRYSLQPNTTVNLPPVDYVSWCNEHNLAVIAPFISIGNFIKYSRHEVNEIFYRNLLESNNVGFEE